MFSTKLLINHQIGRAEDKGHESDVDSSLQWDTEPSFSPVLELGHLHNYKFAVTILLPSLHFLYVVTKIALEGFLRYLDF